MWRVMGGPHLCGRIHSGFELQQLSNNFYMALLRGQMESIQTILRWENIFSTLVRDVIGLKICVRRYCSINYT